MSRGALPALPLISAGNEDVVFSHKSLKGTSPDSVDNERLAFLGSAVYHASVTKYLCAKFPTQRTGYLTMIRSSLVSKEYLAVFSLAYQLPQRLRLQPGLSVHHLPPAQMEVFQAYLGAITLERGTEVLDSFVKSLLDSIPPTDEVWNPRNGGSKPPSVVAPSPSPSTSVSANRVTPSLANGDQQPGPGTLSQIPPPYEPPEPTSPRLHDDIESLYGSPARVPQELPTSQLQSQQDRREGCSSPGIVHIPAKRPLSAHDSPKRPAPSLPRAPSSTPPDPVRLAASATQTTVSAVTPAPLVAPAPVLKARADLLALFSNKPFQSPPSLTNNGHTAASEPPSSFSFNQSMTPASPLATNKDLHFPLSQPSLSEQSSPTKTEGTEEIENHFKAWLQQQLASSSTSSPSSSLSASFRTAGQSTPTVAPSAGASPGTATPSHFPSFSGVQPSAVPQPPSSPIKDSSGKPYMSQLLEEATRRKVGPLTWDFESSGPSHLPRWEARIKCMGIIVGRGSAQNKTIARTMAARNALESLEWPIID